MTIDAMRTFLTNCGYTNIYAETRRAEYFVCEKNDKKVILEFDQVAKMMGE